MIFALLSLIGATLTLPGHSRDRADDRDGGGCHSADLSSAIREEMRSAKGPARAIELGYEKALSSILDANITTFLTALILFAMGSGPIRGFAITLGLGIITSLFTALFVLRLFMVLYFERVRPKTLNI
jgi:preprotein translocase subunit SecD